MPVSTEDARKVEDHISRTFNADDARGRAEAIRRLFVEVLDFDADTGQISLAAAPASVTLPETAWRVAQLDGVKVLYIGLDTPETDRVRKAEASASARLIADKLGSEDLLLAFTNTSADQLHLIWPDLEPARPSLRRMTVERDLPRRTAAEQLAGIYSKRDKRPIRVAIRDAFDVEPVTKEFFAEYKRLFEAAKQAVTGFDPSSEEGTTLEEREERADENLHLFVQTLFNRLLFVYFLSRKGWLTFNGDNDYLNALWKDYQESAEETNFYRDRLCHLFFFGLNNSQSSDLNFRDRFMETRIGRPPFLNGGLFEQTALDRRNNVDVPDETIKPVLKDLFDKFNFTVMESTPFDVEVAVDPEMLGKVFEELVTGRNESGSYYTPRTVVSFMCRESLKGHLETRDTGLTSDVIAGFVDEHRTASIDVAAARRVAQALGEVTVVDPACGSGAYLLGMMQELVELQTVLFNAGADAKSLHDLKLEIIERNLYGADIDEFAINIAMLRLWLSLAIEDQPPIEPLPNLNFKVVKGDSLLGPDPGPENYGDLFQARAHGVAAELAAQKQRFMSATTGKDEIKEAVQQLEDDLRDALADVAAPPGAVDWRVTFAEVFDRGGFDIAVANPPYIQLQKEGGKLANAYRACGYETFARTG